jgi:hypothetical protein
MSEQSDQLRREELRHEVRAHLYERGMGIAQNADTINRAMHRRGLRFANNEVGAACLYWTGLKQVEEVRDEAGATRHYSITAEGIKAYESSLV